MTWRRGVLYLLPFLAVLSGCDGPAQLSDVKVNLLVFDDGTGQMSWSLRGKHEPEAMVEYGHQFAEALGLPEPAVEPGQGPATFEGLSTDSLTVDVSQLLVTIRTIAPDLADSVFVSVCTPQGMGRIDGRGMASEHWGACATFARHRGTIDVAQPSATVHFGSRWHPATRWLAVGAVAFVLGALALTVDRRIRPKWVSQAASLVTVVALVVCASVTWKSLTALGAAASGPYLATGMSFDEGMGGWFNSVAVITFGMTVVLLLCCLIDLYLRDRRAELNQTRSSGQADSQQLPL